ncbi:unnamed protein product, partial [Polarella glacialis]
VFPSSASLADCGGGEPGPSPRGLYPETVADVRKQAAKVSVERRPSDRQPSRLIAFGASPTSGSPGASVASVAAGSSVARSSVPGSHKGAGATSATSTGAS